MGPAARVLAALAPLLLLLLGAPLARGDCGEPPEVQHTQPPDLSGQKSFSVGKSVTYKCAPGLVKMPGLPDSVVCQQDGQWSELAVFCNRSCDVPPRLLFAFLRIRYSKQNYFPAGSTVHYSCREGYTKVMSDKLTCLPEFVWSKPNEFCKKKPCPNPGEIKNGHINITTDMLFGATILFSCDTGYKLVGAASSYCTVMGNNVGWSSTPPECKEISCSAPPEVHNGTIQEPQPLYVYRQSVTYKCAEGFTLAGDKSIYCTVKDGEGAWSGPPPECRDNSQIPKVTPTVQKPTTVKTPVTRPKPTPPRSTSVHISAAQTAATTRATTRAHATSATKRRGPPPSGAGTTVFAGRITFAVKSVECGSHECSRVRPSHLTDPRDSLSVVVNCIVCTCRVLLTVLPIFPPSRSRCRYYNNWYPNSSQNLLEVWKIRVS
ncbi:complement decay-accelerating factor isoform X3 [Erinaceus europaeus]|uniref:Complement decay-accelerating factor isoform X3 n=1 Tax=Erinaceus europaeus TaxID=9365 RepID=A0ABM3WCM5_ERIEU|nr:complement decay-accelerating factor isoform X3 [Erinaceus europaeus]